MNTLTVNDSGPLTWLDSGLCSQTDPEVFFPQKGGTSQPAKRVCRGCPVRAECLAYALNNKIRAGVWGGLSAEERRRAAHPPV